VSKQFASDVEHGKTTVQLGLVLKLLLELGVPLTLDIPKDAEGELAAQRVKGVRPPRKRKSALTHRRGDSESSGSSDIG
jgi:hypothetical protein